MNAKQNGKAQAQVIGTSMPMNRAFYAKLGEQKSQEQYQARKAQINFLNAWDNEWNELPTVQMPAIRINH